MDFLAYAIILGLIPAVIAQTKGRSFFTWWLYGTLLFIVAIIHSIIISDKNSEQANTRKCPYCAEMVKEEAKICRFCHKDLPEPSGDEIVTNKQPDGSGAKILLLILLLFVLFYFARVYEPPRAGAGNTGQDVNEFLAERLDIPSPTAISSTPEAIETTNFGDIPATQMSQITSYCTDLIPDSFSLRETCISQEVEARNSIFSKINNQQIFDYCYELVGESYALLDACIRQEEASRTRLSR